MTAIALQKLPQHNILLTIELHVQQGGRCTKGGVHLGIGIETAEQHRQTLMIIHVQGILVDLFLADFLGQLLLLGIGTFLQKFKHHCMKGKVSSDLIKLKIKTYFSFAWDICLQRPEIQPTEFESVCYQWVW